MEYHLLMKRLKRNGNLQQIMMDGQKGKFEKVTSVVLKNNAHIQST